MSWYYRASREKLPDGGWYYTVREFHVWEKGNTWTANPVRAGGESRKELIEDLEMMLEDVKKHRAFTIKNTDPLVSLDIHELASEADTSVNDLELKDD